MQTIGKKTKYSDYSKWAVLDRSIH